MTQRLRSEIDKEINEASSEKSYKQLKLEALFDLRDTANEIKELLVFIKSK